LGSFRFGTRTVNAVSGSATPEFVPLTKWIPAAMVKYIKVLLQLRDRTGQFQVAVALQTAATDPDSPDSFVVKGTYLATNSKQVLALTDVSSDVDSKFYVRFGIAVKNGAGSNLERGEVRLTVTGRDA